MIYSIVISLILQVSSLFWNYWGDGKAELSRYEAIQNRYGENREADVVMIFVTEPFNFKKQVKSDTYDKNSEIIDNVLKLNKVKDFQTGIYDYNLMTSVFTAINPYKIDNSQLPSGSALKVTFSGQEWCGLVHHQLNREANRFVSRQYSYFESEGDKKTYHKTNKKTILADNLFIMVRELISEFPEGKIQIFPTLDYIRLYHKPLKSIDANVQKKNIKQEFKGTTIDATEFEISSDKLSWTFIVENEYPRKIIYYEFKDSNTVLESGTLKVSVRETYWRLNANKDEVYLEKLMYKKQ